MVRRKTSYLLAEAGTPFKAGRSPLPRSQCLIFGSIFQKEAVQEDAEDVDKLKEESATFAEQIKSLKEQLKSVLISELPTIMRCFN